MAEHLIYLNDENFKSTISKGVTLVDFYADWCGPCKMITPIIEALALTFKGQVNIAKLDIDQSQMITGEYRVTSIPTIILFKDGVEIKRLVGVHDKDSLEKLVRAAL